MHGINNFVVSHKGAVHFRAFYCIFWSMDVSQTQHHLLDFPAPGKLYFEQRRNFPLLGRGRLRSAILVKASGLFNSWIDSKLIK